MEVVHDDPLSRNRFRNVRNYINSLLDQEQTDDTPSNTENTEAHNVSEEKLPEQQFNDLLIEITQDTQDEYFNCQEEGNTLTEEYTLCTSCNSNFWVLPLTIYTHQTPDYTKTVFPPYLEIDFRLDLGAMPTLLNSDSWNEAKEYHKLQLKASTFVLSVANNFKLQSTGTLNVTLHPDVTAIRTLRKTSFTLIFHVSNTKFNILGTPFLEKYVDWIICSSHTLEIKQSHDLKSLKYYDSSTKSTPYCSRLFLVISDKSLHFQPFGHRILTYSLTAYDCKNKYPNGTILYASDFYCIPLRKNTFISIMDKNNRDYQYQSFIQILLQKPLKSFTNTC